MFSESVLTNILLALVLCGCVVDIWYTRIWLRESRRALIEIQKQARQVLEQDARS
jgi:hypothetical protein